MNVYDKSPRLLMTNALVQVASIASSSLWFIMSVATLLVTIILPFAKGRLPPTVPRLPKETPPADHTRSQGSTHSGTTIVVVPGDGHYRLSLDDATGVVHRTTTRGPAPSAITIVPPISGTITITARPDSEDLAITTTLNPSNSNAVPQRSRKLSTSAPVSPRLAPASLEKDSRESQSVVSGTKRLPSVFRRKNKRSDNGRRRSASRSLSPIRSLLPELKREPSEPADAHGRIPYKPIPDEHEVLQTKFVNPFKGLKPKSRRNSLASSPMPDGTSCTLPSPSSSPASTPRRLLSSYITRAMRPLHDAAARSPSPRRWSLSSTTTSSSASSSSASSCRSCAAPSPARTQPYGAPYFAPMPLSRPSSRRASSSRGASEGRKPDLRRANTVARSTAVEDENMLGVSLGQEATRHRRVHSLDVGAAKAAR